MCFDSGGDNKIEDTADMRAQQQINTKLWNYYIKNYKPVVQKYIKNVTDTGIQTEEAKAVIGQINADIMQKAGRNVSINALDNAIQAASLAKLKSESQVKGKEGAKARQLGELQNIVNIGSGQATQAQAGLSEIAAASVNEQIAEAATEQEAQAIEENAYGSALGAMAGIFYKADSSKRGLTFDPYAEDLRG